MTSPSARPVRRIIGFGGGGFTATERDGPLEDYVVSMIEAAAPRICLLPTAGGDCEQQIQRFQLAFRARGCEPSHVSLFRLGEQPIDLREHLLAQDAIYVGGGSLLNLMAIWRAHGLDAILREAWEAGIVLCGVSAGSMCWFEYGITSSYGPPAPVAGLGLLPGSNSVHFDTQPHRRLVFREQVAAGLAAGFGADDGVGLRFDGTTLAEVVTARRGGQAWRVEMRRGEVVETPLLPTVLPGASTDESTVSIAEFRADRHRRRAAGGR
ncbi:MAG: peptidase E [Thermoleophilaceae bacterium]|nr:peptidase E [Thermoleophilaceae bacterium]